MTTESLPFPGAGAGITGAGGVNSGLIDCGKAKKAEAAVMLSTPANTNAEMIILRRLFMAVKAKDL